MLDLEEALDLPDGVAEERQLASGRHGHDDEVLRLVDVAQVKIELVLQVNIALLVPTDQVSS